MTGVHTRGLLLDALRALLLEQLHEAGVSCYAWKNKLVLHHAAVVLNLLRSLLYIVA